MKKLRMIVTSVVVLAIVGSAFAFNATKKIGAFCVSDSPTSTDCSEVFVESKRTTGAGVQRRYFIAWDGASVPNCQSATCATGPVTFTTD